MDGKSWLTSELPAVARKNDAAILLSALPAHMPEAERVAAIRQRGSQHPALAGLTLEAINSGWTLEDFTGLALREMSR